MKYLILLSTILVLVACGNEHAHDHAHDHDHDHDHAHHDHDGHGHADEQTDEHAHVHKAMNGGTLIEVGDHEANLEVLCDRKTGTLTVYIFGAHAEKPVRLKDESIAVSMKRADEVFELKVAAQASSLSQETVGDSSTFKVTDERLKTTEALSITVPSISIYGKSFAQLSTKLP